MQLKDILPYLDIMDYVYLWANDIKSEDGEDLLFNGFIMDIPWVYMNYYLSNDDNGEAISARPYGKDAKVPAGFVIKVVEKQKIGGNTYAF